MDNRHGPFLILSSVQLIGQADFVAHLYTGPAQPNKQTKHLFRATQLVLGPPQKKHFGEKKVWANHRPPYTIASPKP